MIPFSRLLTALLRTAIPPLFAHPRVYLLCGKGIDLWDGALQITRRRVHEVVNPRFKAFGLRGGLANSEPPVHLILKWPLRLFASSMKGK